MGRGGRWPEEGGGRRREVGVGGRGRRREVGVGGRWAEGGQSKSGDVTFRSVGICGCACVCVCVHTSLCVFLSWTFSDSGDVM